MKSPRPSTIMSSLRHTLPLGLLLLLTLTACDNRNYTDGYTAGEKAGRTAGERTGYRQGYAAGTLRVVGADWLPSLGLGICGGIALIAGGITLRLLWDGAAGLAFGAGRLGAVIAHRFDEWSFHRTLGARIDRMRQHELADVDARVRIQAAQLLRQSHQTLGEEEIRIAAEQFLRSTDLIRGMKDNIEISMAACEDALTHIHEHPDLTAEKKARLLRHLAQAIPIAA